ncbi:hypothetical protein ACKUB1_00155 [Methanospirillum stamsii]|uniref:hypothetical protein n=1 Tax=Methanospirillum stamsii TaxID=1277351 RepID=UPI0015E866DD|nr:hypothetical protein [Methanospirillum stamsii]
MTNQPLLLIGKYQFIIVLCLSSSFLLFSFATAETALAADEPAVIRFVLTDYGDKDILRVNLMKEGESSKNGMVRQNQNIKFDRETDTLVWTPCNDNSCTVPSTSTAGGNSGRDQLILEVTFANPSVDIESCHSDTTCERLKGATTVKSGMLEGYFKTGRTYSVSLDSLIPGIGEAYSIVEL